MDQDIIGKLIEEIMDKTRMEAYSLNIQKDSHPGIFDSKFGGLPYWDMKKEYPRDSSGNKLMLLAQLNLGTAVLDDRLPSQGMLQFFTGLNDLYGSDFEQPDCQDTFRVIYHESVDDTVTAEQILSLALPVSTDPQMEEYTPIFREAALNIVKKEIYMGDCDYRFVHYFQEAVKEKLGTDIKNQSPCQFLDDDAYDKLTEHVSNQGHWLLGYPFFTQTDPREYEENYRYYDTLLLQIDSEDIDGEDYVLWGDCGAAGFFINHKDLERKDFSKILYNWDCY